MDSRRDCINRRRCRYQTSRCTNRYRQRSRVQRYSHCNYNWIDSRDRMSHRMGRERIERVIDTLENGIDSLLYHRCPPQTTSHSHPHSLSIYCLSQALRRYVDISSIITRRVSLQPRPTSIRHSSSTRIVSDRVVDIHSRLYTHHQLSSYPLYLPYSHPIVNIYQSYSAHQVSIYLYSRKR